MQESLKLKLVKKDRFEFNGKEYTIFGSCISAQQDYLIVAYREESTIIYEELAILDGVAIFPEKVFSLLLSIGQIKLTHVSSESHDVVGIQ